MMCTSNLRRLLIVVHIPPHCANVQKSAVQRIAALLNEANHVK